jgi:hypothetical protein
MDKNIFGKIPGLLAKLIDLEKNTTRGKFGVEGIKKEGDIATVAVSYQNIINFPQADNRQAAVAITQKLGDLGRSDCERETYDFRVEARKGQITKLSIKNIQEMEVQNEEQAE